MAAPVTLQKLVSSADQKAALRKALGDLSGVEVMGARVLLAIYIGAETYSLPDGRPGRIIRADGNIKESIWQGTVGLVVKKGHRAFKDDPAANVYFHDADIKVGEWVLFRPADAKRVQINGVDCRLVEDSQLDLVVDDPECITCRS